MRALEASHPNRVGGGDPAGAVVYPPTFYALESVPYLLSPTGDSLLDRLVWMRVLCALLAGVTVGLTFRFLRELVPSTPWAWTIGALALAFLPMFDFISGGVQNDAGLYACAAGLFWAMTRVLRNGLTPLRGFAVGGTPPFGHPERVRTFLDRDLLGFDEIWAAAGTPDAVFRTTPEELRLTSRAEVADLKETPPGG